MKDTIYREAAIEAAIEATDDWDGGYSKERERFIRDALEELPHAQSERKTGKWIVASEFEDCRYAKCNQCKVTQIFYYGKPLTNFCPNCGADMRGEHGG